MKKLTLLLLGGVLAVGAQAQQLRQRSVVLAGEGQKMEAVASEKKIPYVSTASRNARQHNAFAKGTSTPFYTQNFAGGIPTGWSAVSLIGPTATWHWTSQAATGQFNIGALNSTTSSNGWMIYDSDSIGSLPGAPSVFSGALVSATISCAGHNTVKVGFQQYFRHFADSCFVDVSNNGGTSWTPFNVYPNNAMSNNTSLSTNPTLTEVNISSVAANQANVKIRFRYVNTFAGGAFNWLIDDVTLSELDPIDIGIAKTGVVTVGPTAGFTNFFSFQAIPIQLRDSVIPVVYLSNYGSTPGTNVNITCKIFNGTTQVFTQSQTYPSLVVNSVDTIIAFQAPSFWPASTGTYTVVTSINPTGDAVSSNNQDTVKFVITDSLYSSEGVASGGGYYIHRPTSAGNELSYYQGNRFSIPDGRTDTLTALSVCFNSSTTPGVKVMGQIYKANAAGSGFNWLQVAKTVTKTLAAGDISTSGTSGTLVYTELPMLGTGSAINNLKLASGDYAAVITGVGVTSSQTIVINSTVSPFVAAPSVIGYTGQSDTSTNDGSYAFAVGGGIATGSITVPRVRQIFGKYQHVGVNDIPGVVVATPYPNPANTFYNIPVSVKQSTEVKISITNLLGQVVRTHDMGTINAGSSSIASVNISDLSNGVYIYTVEANGHRIADRMIISH